MPRGTVCVHGSVIMCCELARQEQASSGDGSGLPRSSCCTKTPLTEWILKDRCLTSHCISTGWKG